MNGRRRLLHIEVPFGILGAAAVASAGVFAAIGIPVWIPLAPMVRLGVPSPLSGMTRSFVALAGGDVTAAFAWHPLGPLAFVACAALPVVAIASWVAGHRLEVLSRLVRRTSLWVAFSVIAAAAWLRQIIALG